jgi:hypothetical protein
LALAGAELGAWNFLASSFQAIGLEITSATRASFLIQARSACQCCMHAPATMQQRRKQLHAKPEHLKMCHQELKKLQKRATFAGCFLAALWCRADA